MKRVISLLVVVAVLALTSATATAQVRGGRRVYRSAIDRGGYGGGYYGDCYGGYSSCRGDYYDHYDRYDRYDRYRRGNVVRDLAILATVVGGVVITNKIVESKIRRAEDRENAPVVAGGGQLYIENSTGTLARLIDNNQVVKEFEPGESVWVGLSATGYSVLYMVMQNGRTVWQLGQLAGNATELKIKR